MWRHAEAVSTKRRGGVCVSTVRGRVEEEGGKPGLAGAAAVGCADLDLVNNLCASATLRLTTS